ncbi:MAG: DUF1232 domain-containing protein [Bdellovibrionaceae bacterium]|nr:DUF1232 domain-containing protein [Bdellovibrionales bacterium]MCB9084934.1 DUF1232 domain-containing protein [Pseudobdellovibrionaceae bacterium]
MTFIKKLLTFLRNVVQDERIPARDKKVLLALIALIVSPVDIIPDWIPILGLVDDFVLVAIVLDYFFEVLDSEVLLSHYPWGMKSFTALRQSSRLITRLTPRSLKNLIWKYESSPYKK